MRKWMVWIMLGLLFVSACSNKESHDDVTSVNDGAIGDLRQETASADMLPEFLDDHDENMQVLYTAVAKHQELLSHMPCYCGCGEIGHEHNLNCFIHETKEDGSIVWDDHATRCQVCLDIAAEAIIELNDGKTIDVIRDQMDKKYEGEGYPEPTETPRYKS